MDKKDLYLLFQQQSNKLLMLMDSRNSDITKINENLSGIGFNTFLEEVNSEYRNILTSKLDKLIDSEEAVFGNLVKQWKNYKGALA